MIPSLRKNQFQVGKGEDGGMSRIQILSLTILGIYFVGLQGAFSKMRTDSEARYRDFYIWRTNKASHERKLEKEAEKFRKQRQLHQERYEQLSAQYSIKRKTQRQLNTDKKAEEWMRLQNKIHRQRLDQAQKIYIQRNQTLQFHRIPENEEMDID